MRRDGFTLLELIIALGILTVVGMISVVAMQTATSSAELASTSGTVQAELRNTMQVLTREVQFGAKTGNDALDPVLEDVQVRLNPAPGAPVELQYQVPVDNTGRRWSRRILVRHVNEDLNANNRLDAGEDTDGDGTLSRRLVRLQDRNNNGTFTDPDELRSFGGANNLSDVRFARDGNVVTVSLTATKLMGSRGERPLSATVTGRIYLQN